jgi:hypothetical protein
MRNVTKRFRHYELGFLTFDYTYLRLGQRSELRMTTCTPRKNTPRACSAACDSL